MRTTGYVLSEFTRNEKMFTEVQIPQKEYSLWKITEEI
jgi:hypothetical protein